MNNNIQVITNKKQKEYLKKKKENKTTKKHKSYDNRQDLLPSLRGGRLAAPRVRGGRAQPLQLLPGIIKNSRIA